MRLVQSVILLIIVLVLWSCKITKDAAGTMDDAGKQASEKREQTESERRLLTRNRSQLSDIYASQNHDYPEVFKQTLNQDKDQEVDYRGFRIQLISTRDQRLADSTEKRFHRWQEKNPITYQPDSYSFFRPPNYRVHVGDFQSRQRAIQYSRLLKKAFPAAWVVHDRIRPQRVPADTVDIAFISDSLRTKHDTTHAPTDTLSIELNKDAKR